MSPSASCEIADIGEVQRRRIDPELRMRAIGQHAAGAPDRVRSVARAGAVGGADIERHAGDDEIRRHGSLRVMPRKPGAVAKVGTSVIVYGLTRAMTISARIRTMISNSISSVRLARLSSYSAEYVSRMIASLRSTAAFTSGTRNSSSADA